MDTTKKYMNESPLSALFTYALGILTTLGTLYMGVAMANKETRLATIRALQNKKFGIKEIDFFIATWATFFKRVFGESLLAKRQILSIPLYTLVVSAVFFLIWIAELFILRNPAHSLRIADLPLNVKEAVSVFYIKGIWAALLIDFFSIQMTKKAIRIGSVRGFLSWRFLGCFCFSVIGSYILFTFAVFIFRVEDMAYVYSHIVPRDPPPLIPYTPLRYLSSSLNLFYPETTVYTTSVGWLTTYFMPQPVILYCAIATQTTLVITLFAATVSATLQTFKRSLLWTVRSFGNPDVHANYLVILFFCVLASIAIGAFSIYGYLVK
ncbi:hypothetical protein G5S34_02500 [Herbaspirillum frisingense]|uniref:hypothetical protein n=1 Tax=Herbaspirillum frisingense TaxID=92645 RepID=UPI001601E028|nr:hypothetical protein [Herbaspirillum frisingense]QNB05759.1 hypothetical protein G5S34_02500 [Herbaspirillum frisingense]